MFKTSVPEVQLKRFENRNSIGVNETKQGDQIYTICLIRNAGLVLSVLTFILFGNKISHIVYKHAGVMLSKLGKVDTSGVTKYFNNIYYGTLLSTKIKINARQR